MTRLPGFAQRVVALDVSLRFVRQSQSLWRLYRRRVHRLSVDQAVQQVQNMCLRWRAGLQRQFDGGEHGLLVVLENQGEISTISRSPPGVLSMRCCRARKAGLQGSPRKGPEFAPKPPSQCEREIGFTRQFLERREASCPNDRTPDRIAAGLEARLRPQVLGAAPRASRLSPRGKDHPNTG